MASHEKHCTLNPNRVCRVCDNKDDACPMCKFSKIRIDIKNGIKPEQDFFNLKEEMEKYWEEKRREGIERDYYSNI